MSAASPGVVSLFFHNDYYKTQDEYLHAIADAMQYEYEAIANAGLVLQLDCPDLGMGRHVQYADLSLEEFRKKARLHVEALNHAVRNIPPDRMRMHLCWGNYEAPHQMDVPLADIIDVVLLARPAAISFEAANPRHAHEWAVFEKVKLPDGKILIPGCSNRSRTSSSIPSSSHSALAATRLCWPRKRHARNRLRLRHLGRPGRGRSRRGLGQIGCDVGRRAAGVTAVLGPCRRVAGCPREFAENQRPLLLRTAQARNAVRAPQAGPGAGRRTSGCYWRLVETSEQLPRAVIDRDRTVQRRVIPAAAAERDCADTRTRSGFDVIRRIADHQRVRGGSGNFLERCMDDVRFRLRLFRIVSGGGVTEQRESTGDFQQGFELVAFGGARCNRIETVGS
jgi:hypothetical protein